MFRKTALLLAVLGTGLAAVGTAAAQAPSRRALRIDDYFAIERLSDPRVSPEGDQVAYVVTLENLEKNRSDSRVWMVPTGGGEAIPMTRASDSASRPRWSPDGRYLSFLSARDGGETQVWALDRRGGEGIRLTDVKQGVEAYEWAPDGKRMVLLIRDPKPDKGDDEKTDKDGKDEAPEVPDPWVIDRLQMKRDYVGYLDHRRTHLYMFDLADKTTRQITSGDTDDSQPAFSPDGRRIAFVSNRTAEPDANYNSDIWIVDPDTADAAGNLLQVTTSPGSDSNPAWSPDGE